MIGWERRVLLRHYLEQGMTKTELAERFGISRQTIYRWIRSGELDRDLSAAGVHYSARAPVATKLLVKLDRYRDILVSRLGEYPDLTAVRLFEEIKAAGYAGGCAASAVLSTCNATCWPRSRIACASVWRARLPPSSGPPGSLSRRSAWPRSRRAGTRSSPRQSTCLSGASRPPPSSTRSPSPTGPDCAPRTASSACTPRSSVGWRRRLPRPSQRAPPHHCGCSKDYAVWSERYLDLTLLEPKEVAKEYVRKVRPRAPEEPVVRFETPPGHQGQVDFADFRLPWGKRYAFLVVLGFSRVLWLQFFTRQTMLHVFEGLEAAFTFFGGVPRELLFDQMKAVVTKDERAAGGRVTENAEFLRFAHHWDFRVRACRPYRAKTKGKVERPVSYVRSSFFYGRTFTSDEDLNDQARHWLDHVANVRTHGTLKERPVDRFEHERDLLRPLASRPYRSLVLPPEVTKQAKAVLPRIDVERRPLEAYAQVAGGVR